MATQDLHTLKGFIRALPLQTGSDESVKVALVTEDGTEYQVVHKGVGADLLDHISADVEITGMVTEVDEIPFVHVRNYRLVDGYEDSWYDDDTEH